MKEIILTTNLFQYVNDNLDYCDNQLTYTKQYLEKMMGVKDPNVKNIVISFINDNGQYCDCELMMNGFRDDETYEKLEWLLETIRNKKTNISSIIQSLQNK